jgi:hypothetical protein
MFYVVRVGGVKTGGVVSFGGSFVLADRKQEAGVAL